MLEDTNTNTHRRKKVLSPIEGKNGKTYWRQYGVGFVNKDNSINLYLDGWPSNGKLQVRDWVDDEEYARHRDSAGGAPQPFALRSVPGGMGAAAPGNHELQPAGSNDDLPF